MSILQSHYKDIVYLCNLKDEPFSFQFDSEVYEVGPKEKVLMPRIIAEHGVKRSLYVTDPVVENGIVVSKGNISYYGCDVEEVNHSPKAEPANKGPRKAKDNFVEKEHGAAAVIGSSLMNPSLKNTTDTSTVKR